MPVTAEKKEIVKQIKKKFDDAELVILAEYKGLTVEADRELRSGLRKAKAEYRVYKNSMVRIALEKMADLDADKILTNTSSFIFSKEPVAPAKALVKFIKNNQAIKIKGGIYQQKFITAEKVKELAALPSREELLSKLVYLLNSPLSRFVNVVHGPLRKLVYALTAVKNKKQ